ncbi:MAG TPA: A/G-specific adenine glycosylase [Chthoniobacterales bacterium]|nr:A/G-specific adenine glycosylase [Chthoniobacterales bacterium]
MTSNETRRFQARLLRWYLNNGRDLPWRRTRDPYAILVSEFMLQQTQVVTVLPYYKDWLRRFPTFAALARAPENDVLHAWQGLGYYARARNLQATAKFVAAEHDGRLPSAIGEIVKLPGIGKYTAHAIGTFAFDQAVPIVEANVSRVLSRVFDLRKPIDSTGGRNLLWNYARTLVPRKSATEFNSALLDLGALICLPRKPKCQVCPVKSSCCAKNPELLPIKRPRPQTKRIIERHGFVVSQDRILLQAAQHRWRGMWILPAINGRSKNRLAIYESVFPFTNHRITLKIFHGNACRNSTQRWFSKDELGAIPIPSPHRRAIHALLN